MELTFPRQVESAISGNKWRELLFQFRGRRICVTGAAGSLGSLVSEKLAQASLQKLILLDQDETGLYALEQRLRAQFPSVQLEICVRSLCGMNIAGFLLRAQPDGMIHAAAYKHVPVLELQPEIAILNNFLVTRQLLRAAAHAGVAAFLLISSDKAAWPANVLGLSKRLAELEILHAARHANLRLACVRLFNVWGSRGSLVQTLQRQLAQHQPLTLTHPDMVRRFISAPDAAFWILTAFSLANRGEIFSPPLPPPVKIRDVIGHVLQQSAGQSAPDYPIVITGIRQGERLQEPWLGPNEKAEIHPSGMRQIQGQLPQELFALADLVADAAASDQPGALRRALHHWREGFAALSQAVSVQPVYNSDTRSFPLASF